MNESLRRLKTRCNLIALDRHDVRRKRIQLRRQGASIIGQRGHGKGITGIDDQCTLPSPASPKKIIQLETDPFQATGLEIGRPHGVGEIHHQHQGREVPEHRHRQPFKGGAGQRQDRQRQPDLRQNPTAAIPPEPL